MTPEVAAAIEEIKRQYEGHTILVGSDKDGGACVIVEGVALAEIYNQQESWIGFHITHSCPYADVYPHFARSDLSRVKGSHPGDISTGHVFPQSGVVVGNSMPSRPAVQISRRSNRRDNASGIETPLLKLLKVLRWLNSL